MIRKSPMPVGFTLIELLICTVITIAIAGVGYELSTRIGAMRVRMQERLEVEDSGRRLLARWREDVNLAHRLDIGPDGDGMTIERRTDDDVLTITYGINDRGQLVRAVGSRIAGTTVREDGIDAEVFGLDIERIGEGYQIAWTARYHDGIRAWDWPQAALATPLTARGRGK